jgi:hypothetical protein
MVVDKLTKGFFFCPTFCQKIQNYPTFSKNCINALLFQIFWYHSTWSCGVLSKVTKFLDLLYHSTLSRGIVSIFFRNFYIGLHLDLRGIFGVFFLKILNTPQLQVEWYNKDKFLAALISVLACIIYKKIIKITYF